MKKLTKEQILMIHNELIRETGGSVGLRDEGLLDSALNVPFQGFGDVDNFPSLQQKGARLGYGLICNHAFVDGNKRIGAYDERQRICYPFATLKKGEINFDFQALIGAINNISQALNYMKLKAGDKKYCSL